jgi:hypothetical protein
MINLMSISTKNPQCSAGFTVFMAIAVFSFFNGCGSSDPSQVNPPVSHIEWTKFANNPVMKKSNIITETYAIGQPVCLFEKDTFKMWYETKAGFCLATSSGEIK